MEILGDIIFDFGGDKIQILPVMYRSKRAYIASVTLNKSFIWRYTIKFKITQNMRLKASSVEDEKRLNEFREFLLRVGDGKIPVSREVGPNAIKIPSTFES
jgi:hypothetical protein